MLTTTGSETAGGVVGTAVLGDRATLSGRFMVAAGSPAPTLTFYLIAPDNSTVYTETQTVTTGVSTYSTKIGRASCRESRQIATYDGAVKKSSKAVNKIVNQ